MRSRWTLLLVALASLVSPGVSLAASPAPAVSARSASASAPSASASPAPSSRPSLPPADCGDLALLVAGSSTASSLELSLTRGIEGIDPDDLLDPYLGSLGLGRADVCGVTLVASRPAVEGMLLRVRGAGPGLRDGLTTALATRLRGYGQAVLEDTIDVAGTTVARLRIGTTAPVTDLLLADVMPDVVLVTTSPPLVEQLLPLAPGVSSAPVAPSVGARSP